MRGSFMKKFLSALLIVTVILFNFSSCAFKSIEDENGLTKLDISPLGNISIISSDFNGEKAVIIYTPFQETEEGGEAETEYTYDNYIALFNVRTGTVKASAKLDEEDVECAFFNNDGKIQVSLYDGKEDIILNNKFKKTETAPHTDYSYQEKAKELGFKPELYETYENFVKKSNYIAYDMLIFYNDPDTNYLVPKDSQYESGFEKMILKSSYNSNQTELSVYDYENGVKVNSFQYENEDNLKSPVCTSLRENCACIPIQNDMGQCTEIYCFNFTKNAENSPFDMQAVKSSDVKNTTKSICKDIKNTYEIDVDMFPKEDKYDFSYKFNNDCPDEDKLLAVSDLKYILSLFPKGMFKEIYDFENGLYEPFERLTVNVCAKILDDNIGAFAGNTNDDIYIVIPCNMFSAATFAHELMHTMEYRIENTVDDFNYNWERLNPDGFHYTEEIDSDVNSIDFADNDIYEKYFMREYSLTNSIEDRATTFEMIFESVINDESYPWWTEKEKKPLYNKAKYINDMIKKSYPSLENGSLWEKYF